MQKRINILSTLLICSMALGLVSFCTSGSFSDGFNEGWADAESSYDAGYQKGRALGEKISFSTSHIQLRPVDYREYADSVYNLRSGKMEKVSLRSMNVRLENQKNPNEWMETVLSVLAIFMALAFIWLFFMFISSVKEGEIFVVENERYLMWMAVIFFTWYVLEWIVCIEMFLFEKSVLAVENYKLSFDVVPALPLVVGVAFLLFRQIFAMARKMKEDQEYMV